MGNWWEGTETKSRRSGRRRSDKYISKSSDKAVEAGEDLADEINKDNPLLGPLLTTAAIAVSTIGDSFGKSFVKVIEWGWPHE